MVKTNPYFTASAASLAFLVVFISLKYLLENKPVDVLSAILGAAVFWIVMFLVHQYLNRKSEI
ncbi:MAG: hypothetical protein WC556_08260 [Candidatus Methanoperedens sp.]